MARRAREQASLDLVASERLDLLMEVVNPAYGVFEQPDSTEAWLKEPHPLLHQSRPLRHGDRRGPGAASASGAGAGRPGVSQGVIRAWRLSKARYAEDLSGQGVARDGQHWNQPGQRAVYLGLTPEITVLEVLVHLNGVLSVPLVLSRYDLPDGPGLISEADPAALPEGWNAVPHGQASSWVWCCPR